MPSGPSDRRRPVLAEPYQFRRGHRGHRLPINEAPKILMLHSLHDPANHYAWATNVHRQTRRTTVLLPYEGAGHSVYRRSDGTRDAVDDYLTELKTPSAGSRCTPAAKN
ncbi:alpha/beta hydrolase [Streptomyces lydicus]|uniref:alpha/beta hydrolase n=1 Tax=Streptomyces lydicus TaxID=47763 RepID=UPI00240E2052|nr:alpha/beta hydrolase [Streptomyces lydicus]